LAVVERDRARRARSVARRQRRRAALDRLTPRLRRRRTGRLGRRSRGQRAGIVVLSLATIAMVWFLVDELALRLVLIALLLVAMPAVVVLALDRRI
jgi:hypothetical protein